MAEGADPITGGILNETLFNTTDVFESFDKVRTTPNFTFEELSAQNSFYFYLNENDLLFHPASSDFEIKVRFTKSDAVDDWKNFRPSFLSFHHLFREIRYELNGQQVDKVNEPGMAWAPIEILTGNPADESSILSASHPPWADADPVPVFNQWMVEDEGHNWREYSFIIDLGQLFPIFRQWRGMYWASTHKFIFIRSNRYKDPFIFDTDGTFTVTPKITTMYLCYRRPRFTPVNDMSMKNALLSGKSQRMEFHGFIYNNVPLGTTSNHYQLLINEETVRCRHMLFWFSKQSNEDSNHIEPFNPEAVDLIRLSVEYDGQIYPQIPILRHNEVDQIHFYKDVADTARSFNIDRRCWLTPGVWKEDCRMYSMDLGAHKDIVAEARMKLSLMVEFTTQKDADYRLHYVLYVDRIAVCNYNGQGRILQSETAATQ